MNSRFYRMIVNIVLTGSLWMVSCSSPEQKETVPKRQERTDGGKRLSYKDLYGDSFPKPTGYVNDFERLFTRAQIETLDSVIIGFEKATTLQIAIVTIDTSMTTVDSFDNYTLKLLKTWGVGQREKNNGILIGFSTGFQKIRIQKGYGIEKLLSDKETKQIIDQHFIPPFLVGSYYQGAYGGLLAIIDKLRHHL